MTFSSHRFSLYSMYTYITGNISHTLRVSSHTLRVRPLCNITSCLFSKSAISVHYMHYGHSSISLPCPEECKFPFNRLPVLPGYRTHCGLLSVIVWAMQAGSMVSL